MIRRSVLALFVVALAACTPQAKAPPANPALDKLFADLAAAPNALEAAPIEQRIWIVWSTSGSPTVDILLERAQGAEAAGDLPRARAFLDEAAVLKPDYAEIYNRRAALAYANEDFKGAIADIERTLEREPRHFGAYAGLGMIYEAIGENRAALEAYKSALRVHPNLEAAKAGVQRLEPQTEGRES